MEYCEDEVSYSTTEMEVTPSQSSMSCVAFEDQGLVNLPSDRKAATVSMMLVENDAQSDWGLTSIPSVISSMSGTQHGYFSDAPLRLGVHLVDSSSDLASLHPKLDATLPMLDTTDDYMSDDDSLINGTGLGPHPGDAFFFEGNQFRYLDFADFEIYSGDSLEEESESFPTFA
jgi:hypothetical protein